MFFKGYFKEFIDIWNCLSIELVIMLNLSYPPWNKVIVIKIFLFDQKKASKTTVRTKLEYN